MSDAAGIIPEDDMTPAERERWLRDRGVVIETAVDRRRAETILSGEGRDEGGGPGIVEMVRGLTIEGVDDVGVDGIKFVYIPHDDSRPVSTLTLPRRVAESLGPTAGGGGGDVIPIYVRSYFADGASIDAKLFEEQAKKQNHQALFGGGEQLRLDEIKSSSSLVNVAAEGSVETFPLVRPSTTNHHVGAYVYLDEVGMLKNLPINKRASSLALKCGYNPPPNFYGDVFVGRISSIPHVHNVDMTREDVLDSNREWIVNAPGENISWQKMVNDVTGREGTSQPDHAGTEGVAVHVDGGGDDEDGGGGCSYSWTQNDEEVEITVSPNRRGGDGEEVVVDKSSIEVVFRPQKISVKRDGEPILDVQLYSRLDVNGCTWTLDEDGLVITCEKSSEGEIWPRLELSPR